MDTIAVPGKYCFGFVFVRGTTGSPTNPDSGSMSAVVYHGSGTTGALAIDTSVSATCALTATTGLVSVTFLTPNGYSGSDTIGIVISCTVGGVSIATVLNAEVLVPVAGPLPSNVQQIGGVPVQLDANNLLKVDAAAGTAGVTITPIQASVTNPRYATRDLAPIAQGSEPADYWIITDGAGNPINLSGKTVRLVAYKAARVPGDCNPFDTTLTPEFKYETGNGITIGGTSNNTVTVQHSASNTATPGEFLYWLLNVTDLLPLAQGKLPIRPAVWNT